QSQPTRQARHPQMITRGLEIVPVVSAVLATARSGQAMAVRDSCTCEDGRVLCVAALGLTSYSGVVVEIASPNVLDSTQTVKLSLSL
ncbi:hypothetical protein BDR07DRAFT_1409994, partial [Suillus spraguei]